MKQMSIKEIIEWLPKSDFHAREQAFVHFSSKGVEAYIATGIVLCSARDNQDWEKAKCQNMKEYCENELRISYTQAIRMMTIVDKLLPQIIKHSDIVSKISFVNLYEVARVAPMVKDIEALLTQASCDTERGFKANIKEIEGKKAPDTCDCLNADKFFYKCQTCQSIKPIELAELKKRFIDET